MNKYCQLWLTCANSKEADKIANALLIKHLVACVKHIPINSTFHWQGKIEKAKEVLLVMESRLDLFYEIEKEVANVHSYDTFVLATTPVNKLSEKADAWLREELAG